MLSTPNASEQQQEPIDTLQSDDLDDGGFASGRFQWQNVRASFRDHKSNLDLIRKRARYYVPILSWLPKYEWKKNILSDGTPLVLNALSPASFESNHILRLFFNHGFYVFRGFRISSTLLRLLISISLVVIAGVGVAAMLIPQSLAYASLATLPPAYGLYTAFVRENQLQALYILFCAASILSLLILLCSIGAVDCVFYLWNLKATQRGS